MFRSILAIWATLALAGAAGAGDTPVLHPLEAACVDYELTGQLQTGTTTRCHRKYGYEQYEIQDVSLNVGGHKQDTRKHTITIGDTIYAIDLATNTGTRTQNPLYERIVSAMENSSAEDVGLRFISAMGFKPSGDRKTIAGHACEVYRSAQLGTSCVTADGLTLEISIMGMVTTAVRVTVGDGGEDANYTLHERVKITDGPDLNAILKKLNKQ